MNFRKGSKRQLTPMEIMCMHFILSGHHTSSHKCNHIYHKKICNISFQKWGVGVEGRLEFFRKFIRFGSGTLPKKFEHTHTNHQKVTRSLRVPNVGVGFLCLTFFFIKSMCHVVRESRRWYAANEEGGRDEVQNSRRLMSTGQVVKVQPLNTQTLQS